MRKKLVIRAGAIVTVLVVSLFTVLPDLVNAEGEDGQETFEELVGEVPVEIPVEVPVEQPVGNPEVEATVEPPAEQSAEQPVEPPTEQPVEPPTEQSAEQPVEPPAEQPTNPPAEQPGNEIPVEQPEEVDIEIPQEVQIEVQRGEVQVDAAYTGNSAVTGAGASAVESLEVAEGQNVESSEVTTDMGTLENEEKVILVEIAEEKNDKKASETEEPVVQRSEVNTSTVRAAAPSAPVETAAVVSQGENNHVKDATPKTGVEDYGMYFLLGAIMLFGAACLAYSKKLNYEE